MGDAHVTGVRCSNCGHQFEDLDAAMELGPDGRHAACPDCGGDGRAVDLHATETIQLLTQIRANAKRGGSKDWYKTMKSGDEYYRLGDEWHTVERVIDRENNWYDERILDSHGNVVREVHEPLDEHRDRGDAKKRGPGAED